MKLPLARLLALIALALSAPFAWLLTCRTLYLLLVEFSRLLGFEIASLVNAQAIGAALFGSFAIFGAFGLLTERALRADIAKANQE